MSRPYRAMNSSQRRPWHRAPRSVTRVTGGCRVAIKIVLQALRPRPFINTHSRTRNITRPAVFRRHRKNSHKIRVFRTGFWGDDGWETQGGRGQVPGEAVRVPGSPSSYRQVARQNPAD